MSSVHQNQYEQAVDFWKRSLVRIRRSTISMKKTLWNHLPTPAVRRSRRPI